jgi:hypothetical protein
VSLIVRARRCRPLHCCSQNQSQGAWAWHQLSVQVTGATLPRREGSDDGQARSLSSQSALCSVLLCLRLLLIRAAATNSSSLTPTKDGYTETTYSLLSLVLSYHTAPSHTASIVYCAGVQCNCLPCAATELHSSNRIPRINLYQPIHTTMSSSREGSRDRGLVKHHTHSWSECSTASGRASVPM